MAYACMCLIDHIGQCLSSLYSDDSNKRISTVSLSASSLKDSILMHSAIFYYTQYKYVGFTLIKGGGASFLINSVSLPFGNIFLGE